MKLGGCYAIFVAKTCCISCMEVAGKKKKKSQGDMASCTTNSVGPALLQNWNFQDMIGDGSCGVHGAVG